MALVKTTAGVETATLTSTGNAVASAARLYSIYAVCAGSAGSIVLKNGSGGATLATIATPGSATVTINVDFSADGLDFPSALHATLTSVTSVLFVYG